MGKAVTLFYDAEGDTLIAERTHPYPEQVTRAVADGVIVRQNPKTGAVESLEVWNFVRRAGGEEGLELPILAEFAVSQSGNRLVV